MVVAAMTERITVYFNFTRAKPNTWSISDDGRSVFIRYFENRATERAGEVPVRFRTHRTGAIHVRPLDGDLATWLTQVWALEPEAKPVEFVLADTPDHVQHALKRV